MGFESDLAALAWQVEMGADACIADAPIDRFAAAEAAKVAAKAPPPFEAPPPPVETGMDWAAEAARLAGAADSLDALDAAIRGFEGCELKKGARNTVVSDGQPGARVMIIGEAPGRDEDRLGKPFVGQAGQLLDRMFAAIDLARTADDPMKALYITNVVYWRPPQNRAPTRDEMAMLRPFALRHIELAKPEFLVLMGNTACGTLLENPPGITKLRGNWQVVAGLPALPMMHPAALLRNSAQKRGSWEDLLALKGRL